MEWWSGFFAGVSTVFAVIVVSALLLAIFAKPLNRR